ncbi:O-antigen ligase family protein [Pandoraea terrigena]|uniref:O-antigen ligase n=1 Tax=Pandoraea terrigena TaxID=2508292 RepID=A0A5E4TB27_9BURK|nr:O-antigen ligase family protein [Pandoraea terrigena]VVD84472.1 O-antigen ligase [Pandoraea terrigena]
MFLLLACSLYVLVADAKMPSPTRSATVMPRHAMTALNIALCLPFAAVILSELIHGHVAGNTLDSPSRFLIAIVVMFALRRVSENLPAWVSFGLPLGAFAAAVMASYSVIELTARAESTFLNPIHFGDIALLLGVLSALSINWLKRDCVSGVIVKLAGSLAGGYASWASLSRGGWIALPVMVVLCVWIGGKALNRRARWAAIIVLCAAIVLPVSLSQTVRTRMFTDISLDLSNMAKGQPDSSVGVRLELYKAALILIGQNPVAGLGAHGFHNAMAPMAEKGVITPTAADLGRGEVHNQILSYTADYGIGGFIAMLAVYFVPAWFFILCIRRGDKRARRTGLLGLLTAVAFFTFGLTVETFNLKVTTAFYATMLAVFAAIACPAKSESVDTKTGTIERN